MTPSKKIVDRQKKKKNKKKLDAPSIKIFFGPSPKKCFGPTKKRRRKNGMDATVGIGQEI